MRVLATGLVLSVMVLSLSGCAGYEKGNGIDRLNTQTAEEKENEAWFGSFYGKNHCGVWEGVCEPGTDNGGSSGGGMWGGGVGPSDGGTASHDSGSSN